MKLEDVKLGRKYRLSRKIEFYNHREGVFASFDEGLVVKACKVNSKFYHPTVVVSFDGGKIEVFPSQLSDYVEN